MLGWVRRNENLKFVISYWVNTLLVDKLSHKIITKYDPNTRKVCVRIRIRSYVTVVSGIDRARIWINLHLICTSVWNQTDSEHGIIQSQHMGSYNPSMPPLLEIWSALQQITAGHGDSQSTMIWTLFGIIDAMGSWSSPLSTMDRIGWLFLAESH